MYVGSIRPHDPNLDRSPVVFEFQRLIMLPDLVGGFSGSSQYCNELVASSMLPGGTVSLGSSRLLGVLAEWDYLFR
jgi:hypothetical protein